MTAALIRPMQEADVSIVTAIEKSAFPYPWGEQAFRDSLHNFNAWVLDADNTLLGYAIVMIAFDQSELLNIAVSPAYQGNRWGEYLLTYIVAELKVRGINTLFLEVRKSNEAAIHLYKKLNFIEVGLRKRYYQTDTGREDALVFKLAL
ncbi:MAG: ribosomal protein S18-alanine N-acetyltransferase [Gammaproteobacteria bacterium]|nr:ribosomal protein S18-alanine N-acetyltransferase [Gammaproteobacteria bacterium]